MLSSIEIPNRIFKIVVIVAKSQATGTGANLYSSNKQIMRLLHLKKQTRGSLIVPLQDLIQEEDVAWWHIVFLYRHNDLLNLLTGKLIVRQFHGGIMCFQIVCAALLLGAFVTFDTCC